MYTMYDEVNIPSRQLVKTLKQMAKEMKKPFLIKMKCDYQLFYRRFKNWPDAIDFVTATMSEPLEKDLGRLSDSYIRHFGIPKPGEDNATVHILKAAIRMKQLYGYRIKLVREN